MSKIYTVLPSGLIVAETSPNYALSNFEALIAVEKTGRILNHWCRSAISMPRAQSEIVPITFVPFEGEHLAFPDVNGFLGRYNLVPVDPFSLLHWHVEHPAFSDEFPNMTLWQVWSTLETVYPEGMEGLENKRRVQRWSHLNFGQYSNGQKSFFSINITRPSDYDSYLSGRWYLAGTQALSN